MVAIRSTNEIILNLLDYFKLTQPNLDTKPGTVARDLFIDAPASQLSLLYDELANISNKQSLRLVAGTDLDKLAKNFGVIRQQSSKANGVALLTFSSIDAPVNINAGAIIYSTNGLSFSVVNGVAVTPNSSNYYRSIATKYRDQLDTIGITDLFAIEVTVQASAPGLVGNIGKYSLNRTNIPGVSNATNILAFTGGSDQEADAVFRNRVLATFTGSSVGTALGYQSLALSTAGVIDANVIEPGDPLMTRDGTEVLTNTDGSKTIVTEGTGGKVDIVILGNTLQETTDSFIYKDKSNNNDPTSSKNNYVIGQISGDENKTVNRKRIDNLNNKVLPQQPVNQLLQVNGSLSGANFVEKSVDVYGRVSGNYELVRDTGVYGGSPWGFDTFKWISNKIKSFQDNQIKGQFNGQDATTFTDVTEISSVQQIISITNEDSEVTSDRSIIQLLHAPISNVTRVFNVNTGERYLVVNQNVDSAGTFNTTGRIKISGNTLPTNTDVLQVDYNWILNYDAYSEYDGLVGTSNIRPVTDSIDWGYNSIIRDEIVTFNLNTNNNYFVGNALTPINTLVTANKFSEVDGTVVRLTSGTFAENLAVIIKTLPQPVDSVGSVKVKNTSIEQYKTAANDGTIINATAVFGIDIVYDATIVLPSDTIVQEGDKVTVFFNYIDTFHQNNSVGNVSGTQINIPATQVNTTATSINLLVSYIANTPEFYSSAIVSLPASRSASGYSLQNNIGFNNFTNVNTLKRESLSVQKNLTNEFYVELNLPSIDYLLTADKVMSIVRLSDGAELWNSSNLGSIIVAVNGNYQVILTGYNAPDVADRVIIFYYANDVRRFQPFTYQNSLIQYRVSQLSLNALNQTLSVPLNHFVSETNIQFSIFEPNTNTVIATVTDGYLVNNNSTAILGSNSILFNSIAGITNKKIKIVNTDSNNGVFDIVSYDSTNNTINISNSLSKLNYNQISIIRLSDNKELWNKNGTIDVANNKIILPLNTNASNNDKVFVYLFNYSNLKQSVSRLIGNLTDQTVNTGTLTVSGTTLTKVADTVFTATNTGLKLNLLEAVKKSLSLTSSSTVPSNLKLAKVLKLEKVTTIAAGSDEVLEVLTTYDLKNQLLNDNSFYINDCLMDSSLQNFEFILPSTVNNTLNTTVQNLPKIGDKLRVTFYYVSSNDSENLAYTRNGILYTNKKFALLDKVFVNSGFNASSSTRISLSSLCQPNINSRYKAFYDYLAPKANERISINYNFNKLISDVTLNLENNRPINADVLVKAAKPILVDLTMNIVLTNNTTISSTTIVQNLKSSLLTTINSNSLGDVIDQITLINIAQGINGVSRARVVYFNKSGVQGQVLTLQAQNDEYFISNNLVINIENR